VEINSLAARQTNEKGMTMNTLTNRQRSIACIAVWLIVSLVILTGSFIFSTDDWWWMATYSALIVFATVFSALLWTLRPGSVSADQNSRTEREQVEPEA
jgi:membrane protein YdbS with pleckstrin-like domain